MDGHSSIAGGFADTEYRLLEQHVSSRAHFRRQFQGSLAAMRQELQRLRTGCDGDHRSHWTTKRDFRRLWGLLAAMFNSIMLSAAGVELVRPYLFDARDPWLQNIPSAHAHHDTIRRRHVTYGFLVDATLSEVESPVDPLDGLPRGLPPNQYPQPNSGVRPEPISHKVNIAFPTTDLVLGGQESMTSVRFQPRLLTKMHGFGKSLDNSGKFDQRPPVVVQVSQEIKVAATDLTRAPTAPIAFVPHASVREHPIFWDMAWVLSLHGTTDLSAVIVKRSDSRSGREYLRVRRRSFTSEYEGHTTQQLPEYRFSMRHDTKDYTMLLEDFLRVVYESPISRTQPRWYQGLARIILQYDGLPFTNSLQRARKLLPIGWLATVPGEEQRSSRAERSCEHPAHITGASEGVQQGRISSLLRVPRVNGSNGVYDDDQCKAYLSHSTAKVRLKLDSEVNFVATATIDAMSGKALFDMIRSQIKPNRELPRLSPGAISKKSERVSLQDPDIVVQSKLTEGIETHSLFHLTEYQHESLRLMEETLKVHSHALLADERGLGKTAVALAFMKRRIQSSHDNKTRALNMVVIVPASQLRHWKEEAHRVCPSITIAEAGETDSAAQLQKADVILASMEIVKSQRSRIDPVARAFWDAKQGVTGCTERAFIYDQMEYGNWQKNRPAVQWPPLEDLTPPSSGYRCFAPLFGIKWNYCFLDEAQSLRNLQCQTASGVLDISAEKRICITGEPVVEQPSDVFPLLRFLRVRPLDDKATFDACFAWSENVSNEKEDHVSNLLGTILMNFSSTHRRDVLAPQYVSWAVHLEDQQRRVVDEQEHIWNSQTLTSETLGAIDDMALYLLHPHIKAFEHDWEALAEDLGTKPGNWRSSKIDAVLHATTTILEEADAAIVKEQDPRARKLKLTSSKIIICDESKCALAAIACGLNESNIAFIHFNEFATDRENTRDRWNEVNEDENVEPLTARVLLATKQDLIQVGSFLFTNHLLVVSRSRDPRLDQHAISRVSHVGNPSSKVHVFRTFDKVDCHLADISERRIRRLKPIFKPEYRLPDGCDIEFVNSYKDFFKLHMRTVPDCKAIRHFEAAEVRAA